MKTGGGWKLVADLDEGICWPVPVEPATNPLDLETSSSHHLQINSLVAKAAAFETTSSHNDCMFLESTSEYK